MRAIVSATPIVLASTNIVLSNHSEAEKVYRLKTNYLERSSPPHGGVQVQECTKIENIVVNCGIGDAEQNSKGLEAAIKDLTVIIVQWLVKTKAKNSIATFKLREGATIRIVV
ncbi:large ribosomal subunit protein uL5c-like [Typha angustifolia]|uniref:large ribosomal subunit protein uL5c-like n=1 Tax=Typha angustifolia TaxID=59011 RepID=UPI003C3081C8